MPESPDFDQMALAIADRFGQDEESMPRAVADIAEQLRQVWNARGAADIAKLETAVPGASTKVLAVALRSLDR